MIEVDKDNRFRLRPMCISVGEDIVLSACIAGRLGSVWTDRAEDPSCAIAVVADVAFLLGRPEAVADAELRRFLTDNAAGKYLITGGAGWAEKLTAYFPDRLETLRRYALSGSRDSFDRSRLGVLAQAADSRYSIERIDGRLYLEAMKESWSEDFCSWFHSSEEFARHGMGYLAMDGDRIVSGASSYYYHEDRIEVTIGTVRECRRQGLAAACAARLILECLERGIYPRWDAANMDSVRLAEKLGYRFDHPYSAYRIGPPTDSGVSG